MLVRQIFTQYNLGTRYVVCKAKGFRAAVFLNVSRRVAESPDMFICCLSAEALSEVDRAVVGRVYAFSNGAIYPVIFPAVSSGGCRS